MHEDCAYSTENSYICCKNKRIADSKKGVAMVVDINCGTLLKIGKINDMINYATTVRDSYNKIGLPMVANDIVLIIYDETSKLSSDEICTIINWFNNSIGPKMKEFIELDYDEALKEIKRLKELGF